jgi:hypothetical protein
MTVQMITSAPTSGPTITPTLDLCPAGAAEGVGLDEAWDAELVARLVDEVVDDTGTDEVAVLPTVLCPATACTVPCVRENTLFPAAQFASPFFASGLHANTLFPQGTREPSLSLTGSSIIISLVVLSRKRCHSLRQKSPHMVEFHRGSVQVPRIVVPAATAWLTAFASVTTQSLFEKQAHPIGQQRLVAACSSQGRWSNA